MTLAPGKVRSTLLISLAILAVAPLSAEEESIADTPLQSRAKSTLETYYQAKTKEAQATVREQMLLMADSLETAGDEVLVTECLERAGLVCYYFAEYERAVEIWDRGLRIARNSGNKKRIAALMNAQAIGASVTGDDEGAIRYQSELLPLRREMGDLFGEAVSLHGMGISYLNLFRFPEAIEALQAALRLLLQTGKAYPIAQTMITLSNALYQVGEIEVAIVMADSAVARAPNVKNPTMLGNALGLRAIQLDNLGRHEEALADFEQAHELLSAAGLRRVAAVNDVHWANLLVSMHRCEEARLTVEAAQQVLNSVAQPEEQVFADCIRARIIARCGDRQDAREAAHATIERFEAIRDSIVGAVSQADAFRLAGGAYTDLAILEAEDGNPQEAWRIVETGAARVLRQDLGLHVASVPLEWLAQLQRRLREIDGIAIQYSVSTGDRALVCVVTPTTVRAVPLNISHELQMDMTRALRLMSSGASDVECQVVLERVSDAVLAPIAESLHDGNIRLLVFPGMLSGFPMEALSLPGNVEAPTVGDLFAVTYVPSATAFIHLEDRRALQGDVVVFADPLASAPEQESPLVSMRAARLTLTPLSEARAEGAAIVGRGDLFVGEEASKEAFRNNAPQAAVLHFASHAVIDASNPTASGVVLAGGTVEGVLTVAEICDVGLAADLVSLSGCRTAGGYVALGEGSFGLTRAFLLAGARSVVSSWWDVEDKAARRFMELFYAELRDGTARDTAVQRARQSMAREGFALRDRAAFAITGATATPVLAVVQSSLELLPIVIALTSLLLLFLVILTRRKLHR